MCSVDNVICSGVVTPSTAFSMSSGSVLNSANAGLRRPRAIKERRIWKYEYNCLELKKKKLSKRNAKGHLPRYFRRMLLLRFKHSTRPEGSNDSHSRILTTSRSCLLVGSWILFWSEDTKSVLCSCVMGGRRVKIWATTNGEFVFSTLNRWYLQFPSWSSPRAGRQLRQGLDAHPRRTFGG